MSVFVWTAGDAVVLTLIAVGVAGYAGVALLEWGKKKLRGQR